VYLRGENLKKDENNVGSFLENLFTDKVEKLIIKMINEDKEHDEILEAVLEKLGEK
jgi:rubrerythrin